MGIKGVIYTVLKRCYTGSCPVTTLKTIGYSKYKLNMNLSDVKSYLGYESYDGYKYMKVIDIRRLKVSQIKELFQLVEIPLYYADFFFKFFECRLG